MITNQKELYIFMYRILKPLGYIKKKETWYLDTPECICFFSLGKSFYGGSYGEAFGCFLKQLEISTKNANYPEYYKSHLRISLSFFIEKEIAEKSFNLENLDYKDNKREEEIECLMEKYVFPFLKAINSKKD